MGYEMLEHTADVGLRVWARTLDELFADAAHGLVAVMGHTDAAPTVEVAVSVEAPDLEALFVDWLSELIYLFEAKGMVPTRPDVHVTADPWRVHGVVRGPDAAEIEQDGPAVKAVTYHRLSVARRDDGYEARVYLDI